MSEQEINRLMMAVKSLMKAVERSIASETYEGIADTMAANYRALHTKIAELHPDDYYVTTVLTLNIPESADDRQKVSLVQLAASQMYHYLASLRAESGFRPGRGFRGHGGPWENDWSRHHDLGREISEEVMAFTKETMRRAFDAFDFDIDIDDEKRKTTPPPPPPHKPPVDPDDLV